MHSAFFAVVRCPSVCLSVTLVYCVEMAKLTNYHYYHQTFFIVWWPHHSSFPTGDQTMKFLRGAPRTGVLNRGGGTNNLRFSTNISLCLANDAR